MPPRPIDTESLLARLRELEKDFAASVLEGNNGQGILAVLRALNVATARGDHAYVDDAAKRAQKLLRQHAVTLPNVPKLTLWAALGAAVKAQKDDHSAAADAVLSRVLGYPSTDLLQLEADLGCRGRIAELREDPAKQAEALRAMTAQLARSVVKRESETRVKHALAALFGVHVKQLKNLYAGIGKREERAAKKSSAG